MARLESIANAGYVPTPLHLIPAIAGLFRVEIPVIDTNVAEWKRPPIPTCGFVDPCCGDGEAVFALQRQLLAGKEGVRSKFWLCEMESSRFKAIPFAGSDVDKLHCDAFRVHFERKGRFDRLEGAQVLYLNPPYDNRSGGRWSETLFLERFQSVLSDDGVLVLVVPGYKLSQMAPIFGLGFTDIRAYRFPGDDFEAFGQVVVIARRTSRGFTNTDVEDLLNRWAAAPEALPNLGSEREVYALPMSAKGGLGQWGSTLFDMMGACSAYVPWHVGGGPKKAATPIHGIHPDPSLVSNTRIYRLATPPKPGHIAAAIAAGIFNGSRVSPDDPSSGLPDILIKGVFDREFVPARTETNDKGEEVAEILVQAPRLVVTVLNLATGTFHTIRNSTEVRKGALTLETLSTGELLDRYGKGLLRNLKDHCKSEYDPTDTTQHFPIPQPGRTLLRAHEHAARAAVQVLGGASASKKKRFGRAAFVLGEIGTGKTSVALAVSSVLKARRTLVMCPTHLVTEWRSEVSKVRPDAAVIVLQDVGDADELLQYSGEKPIIGLLSKETAKLSHGYGSVASGTCPTCGTAIITDDFAEKRMHCGIRQLRPENAVARYLTALVPQLVPYVPRAAIVRKVLRTRQGLRIRQHYANTELTKPWDGIALKTFPSDDVILDHWQEWIDFGFGLKDYAFVSYVVSLVAARGDERRSLLAVVAVLKAIGHGLPDSFAETLVASASRWDAEYTRGFWRDINNVFHKGDPHRAYGFRHGIDAERRVTWNEIPIDSIALLNDSLEKLTAKAVFTESEPCNSALFFAVPSPRRVDLADYLAKRGGNRLDLLILDEAHEYSNEDSAQSIAAHRLTGVGIPTLMLTGSVMKGYAHSLFTNQWALDPEFRKEFKRDQKQDFIRRYGFLKKKAETKDKTSKKTVRYGTMSDRVETVERVIGEAPGVLGLFLLRYLLRISVVLHREDLDMDLPPHSDIVHKVAPTAAQIHGLKKLESALVKQMKKDRFTERAGQLMGAVTELPSFLDRCTRDTGNNGEGAFTIAYPDGEVVASVDLFDASEILPKEEWMLQTLKLELAEGRDAIVLCRHVNLMPRYARLIEQHIGVPVKVLDAKKVSASKRRTWIEKEVLAKQVRVLVVNPVAIQTGLNVLVQFPTQIWMENPNADAVVFRQACGRSDRLGKTVESRAHFPIYDNTVQVGCHKLLMHKVGMSRSVDGLDAGSALAAAGVGELQPMSSFAVARQIYDLVEAEAA